MLSRPCCGFFPHNNTRRSDSGNGSARSQSAFTAEKMAVLAPMPSARVSTATAVKPGFFKSWRKANFKSFMGEGENIEHRTPNIECRKSGKVGCQKFEVR